ncbi:MAG: MFS transporter [Clostridiales bacterium]|jgi:MFS family permease|nr:MFS transporter [Clostridiales bacterium]
MKKLNLFSQYRKFLILWGSQAVSSLGTAMTNFALIIWVYGQDGTASSITLLSVCSLVPSVLFSFIAGTLADRVDKKRIMLLADFMAAIGTTAVLILYLTNNLRIWHLYIINFLLSFMNAFQGPASYVATTLLAPKGQYVRVSGLQALSSSVVTILAPAFGSTLLAFGSLKTVLAFDLASFAVAFTTLLVFIDIPKVASQANKTKESFLKSCSAVINFLREQKALFRIILFFSFINLIAKMGGYGMMPALILSRTAGNQVSLGIVEAAVGIGSLAGSMAVTILKPAKSRTKVIFFACGISFLIGDIGQSFTSLVPVLAALAFFSNLPLPFLSANLTAIMRSKVPVEMQGRVFSARDTIQYSSIPVGMFLGGFLADYVFEPFMQNPSPLQRILEPVFGTGAGSGIAVMFFITGALGSVTSFMCMKNPMYKCLD